MSLGTSYRQGPTRSDVDKRVVRPETYPTSGRVYWRDSSKRMVESTGISNSLDGLTQVPLSSGEEWTFEWEGGPQRLPVHVQDSESV